MSNLVQVSPAYPQRNLDVGLERLEFLADWLEFHKEKIESHFHMNMWANKEPGETPLEHTCGFIGCAIGWACTIPEFRKLGLKLKDRGVLPRQPKGVLNLYPIFTDSYDTCSVNHDACEFFRVSRLDFNKMFLPQSYAAPACGMYITIEDVVQRIRETVKAVTLRIKNIMNP